MKILDKSFGLRSTSGQLEPGDLAFRCNICDQICIKQVNELSREVPSCGCCESTVRLRGMVHVLSLELFGRSLSLSEFPSRSDLRGLGMSDWDLYASKLAQKFDYINTYFHREPKLDICDID